MLLTTTTGFRYVNILNRTRNNNSSLSSSPTITPTLDTAPSQVRTTTCYDLRNYSSPIYNLTCSSLNGTDCRQWQHVGLTALELRDLLVSCPVACGMDCASHVQYLQWNQTLLLHNVSSLASPSTTEVLEKTLLEYTSDYVDAHVDSHDGVVLYRPMLQRQTIWELHYRIRRRRLVDASSNRTNRQHEVSAELAPASVTLLVTMAWQGVSMDMTLDKIQALLAASLQGPGLTRALQASGDESLLHVVATTTRGLPINDKANGDNDNDTPMIQSWAVALVTLAVLLVLALGCCYWRQRVTAARDYQEHETDKDYDGSASNSRNVSRRLQDLSFETTPRLYSSPPRTLGSHTHRDDSSTTSDSDSKGPQLEAENANNTGLQLAIPNCESTASLIPPMIVIDHIEASDDEQPIPSPIRHGSSDHNVVRMEATQDFRRALHRRDTNASSDSLYLDWRHASFEGKAVPGLGSTTGTAEKGGSLSQDNDSLLLRDDNTADFDQLDLAIQQDHDVVASPIASDTSNDDNADMLGDSKRSLVTTFHTALEQEERELSWTNDGQEFIYLEDVLESSLVRMQDEKDEHTSSSLSFVSARDRTIDGSLGRISASFGRAWSRRKNKSAECLSASTPSQSADEDATPRKGVPASASKRVGSYGGRRSLSLSDIDLTSETQQFSVQAPSRGKLGLDIQCLPGKGPMVMAVKDYSPLLGAVLPGDRLISVGGVKTGGLDLALVLKLINGDRSVRLGKTIRLMLIRESDSLCGERPHRPVSDK